MQPQLVNHTVSAGGESVDGVESGLKGVNGLDPFVKLETDSSKLPLLLRKTQLQLARLLLQCCALLAGIGRLRARPLEIFFLFQNQMRPLAFFFALQCIFFYPRK